MASLVYEREIGVAVVRSIFADILVLNLISLLTIEHIRVMLLSFQKLNKLPAIPHLRYSLRLLMHCGLSRGLGSSYLETPYKSIR